MFLKIGSQGATSTLPLRYSCFAFAFNFTKSVPTMYFSDAVRASFDGGGGFGASIDFCIRLDLCCLDPSPGCLTDATDGLDSRLDGSPEGCLDTGAGINDLRRATCMSARGCGSDLLEGRETTGPDGFLETGIGISDLRRATCTSARGRGSDLLEGLPATGIESLDGCPGGLLGMGICDLRRATSISARGGGSDLLEGPAASGACSEAPIVFLRNC